MALEFESPAQKDAAAAAPPAKPVVAEVTRGSLEQDFTASATVVLATHLSATLNAGASGTYVTAAPAAVGSEVRAGTFVTEVNGAPVFAFPGNFPFYRDLHIGDSGPDVTQLQEGLKAAGRDITVDGSFGSNTAAAVREQFKQAGFGVPLEQAQTTSLAPSTGSAPQSPAPASQPSMPQQSANSAVTAPAPATQPFVPAGDLVTFASLPATLTDVPPVGTQISGTTSITVQLGTRVAQATIAASVAVSLRNGMSGTATFQGKSVPVTVTAVQQSTSSSSGASMAVSPQPGSAFPDSWLNQTVLLTIALTASAKDALIVPTSSIDTNASGGGTILVQSRTGGFREVKVNELGELNGKAAIAPYSGQQLKAGDLVEVG